MSNVQIAFLIERGAESCVELELEITGHVSPYVSARRYGPPEACCDAEGGEVEITTITLGGQPFAGKLTDDETERVCEQLAQAYSEQDDEGPDYDDDDDGPDYGRNDYEF